MELTLNQAQEMMERNHGNLDLRGSQIQALPKDLHVAGYIFMDVISSHLRTGFPEMDMEL